jgi:AraC-like DNA-binding protein
MIDDQAAQQFAGNARGAARLIAVPPGLRDLCFVAVERDTRGCDLGPVERVNHYPASPLCTVTIALAGTARLVGPDAAVCEPLPQMCLAGPTNRPVASRNDGPVLAIFLCCFPDALARLTGFEPGALRNRIVALHEGGDTAFLALCDGLLIRGPGADSLSDFLAGLEALWLRVRSEHSATLPARIADWSRAAAYKAALSRPGRGVRQVQRRLQALTGHSRRELEQFARNEVLFEAVVAQPDLAGNLADFAHGNGFADQSHLGRFVRRMTGHSPAEMNQRLAHDEAFWFYRLMRDHY